LIERFALKKKRPGTVRALSFALAFLSVIPKGNLLLLFSLVTGQLSSRLDSLKSAQIETSHPAQQS
jgi:hypothetical protein